MNTKEIKSEASMITIFDAPRSNGTTPIPTPVKGEAKAKPVRPKTLAQIIGDAKAVRGNVRARIVAKNPENVTEKTGKQSRGERKLTDIVVSPADAETDVEKLHLDRLALLASAQRAISALSKAMPKDMPIPSLSDILDA